MSDLTESTGISQPGAQLGAQPMGRRGALRLLGGAGLALAAPGTLAACLPAHNVGGNTRPTLSLRRHSFFDNSRPFVVGPGAWCWFQSPRAAVLDGKLWIGSAVAGTNSARDGDVEVTAVDVASHRVTQRYTLGHTGRTDDHASPSVLVVNGGIQTAWSTHVRTDWIQIGTPGETLQTIHRPQSIVSPGRGVSYASAHIVNGERWMLYRGEKFSWNLLTSRDGRNWVYRGLVVDPGPSGQRPYLIAASSGKELHLIVSDGNPTEFSGTSVGYAVIHPDMTITRNDGAVIGSVGSAPVTAQITRLLTGTPGSSEAGDTDAWMADVQVIDNHPTAILTERSPWPSGSDRVGGWRHRYLWARQRLDGDWTVEHLGWAGSELYGAQPDYTGLGSIDPSNSQRVVISTNVHPLTGDVLRSDADGRNHWELWEGYRHSEGTWSWRALTANSQSDNLRPLIASDGNRKALVWMRGSYRHWTDARTEIVVSV